MYLVCRCLVLLVGILIPATAATVTPDQLFLAPSTVPDDFYPTNMLHFGGSTDVIQMYTSAMLGGLCWACKCCRF
jgi:hypothetical protein